MRRVGQSIPFPVRQVEPRRPVPVPGLDAPFPGENLALGLSGSGLFADLSDSQRQDLVEVSTVLWFAPGEVIVQEGAEGESLYVVLQGTVEVSKQLESQQVVVRQLGMNEVFGEMTLFLDAPRSASVRALDECRLLEVERSAVQALLKNDPALLDRFAALVALRQAELNHLSQEERHAHSTGLLATMRRLFSAVTGP
ncbi:MAG: cyclic nucleotide-binding domain-containing protein [Cyanobium sp.]